MSADVDFLIVGGGLAGRILQLEVQASGYSSKLYDEPENNHSSAVAAGIVNPITGKYFSLSWRADEFFPNLNEYYKGLEEKFKASFFHSLPITRLIQSPGDENTWLSKAKKEKYKGFFEMNKTAHPALDTSFQTLSILRGGYLDIPEFIKSVDIHTERAPFIYEELFIEQSRYKDLRFKYIVFCEGYRAVQNPYFSYLPFTPNKGELLEIESHDLPEDQIIVGSVFILPNGSNKFKVGASYDHFDLSLEPTEKKKEELLDRLSKSVTCTYTIKNHWYGIRPAVRDRRPLLGRHPEHSNMFIFNGLGSKAVSMAPVLAKEILEHIVHQKPLHSEADIARFKTE